MKTLRLFFALNLIPIWLFCQAVDKETAGIIVNNLIQQHGNQNTIALYEPFTYTNNQILAHQFILHPKGFILVAAHRQLAPVIAYSFDNNWEEPASISESLKTLFKKNIISQIHAYQDYEITEKNKITALWEEVLTAPNQKMFEQWPPTGTTSTGGWLETNWTQSSPYNTLCPIDKNSNTHSVAGCPAIAMAQILNYNHTLRSTRLNDSDDYYHNYGANMHFYIDDAWESYGFPSFPMLNLLLDSIDSAFTAERPLINREKAGLVFACGTACKQVYSAGGSGTFGVEQAATAFQRFGFAASRLLYPNDSTLKKEVEDNMKIGFPALLALVDSPVTCGHNLVVDGYNTNGYFHYNFGWGGSYNGWYSIPPTGMPYSINYIEGVIVDINIETIGIEKNNFTNYNNIKVNPNPAKDFINISMPYNNGKIQIELYSMQGILMKQWNNIQINPDIHLPLSNLHPGNYILKLHTPNYNYTKPITIVF